MTPLLDREWPGHRGNRGGMHSGPGVPAHHWQRSRRGPRAPQTAVCGASEARAHSTHGRQFSGHDPTRFREAFGLPVQVALVQTPNLP